MINAVTRAYRLASTKKLLGLLKNCYVDHEVDIEIKSKEIEKAERKEFKVSEREKKLNSMEVYQSPENVDVDQIGSRYAIWAITGKGPFKDFLYKIGLSDNHFCRYCSVRQETAAHLLIEYISSPVNKLSENVTQVYLKKRQKG